MSRFRSLYTRYEQEEERLGGLVRPWPATYRERLPHPSLDDFTLHVGIENQHAKAMTLKQIAALPSFNENRRITSRAGWSYYGHWRGVTFHTLMNLFSNPQFYPWVRLESANGEYFIIDRQALMQYRVVLDCDGAPLSTLYGGPIWVHNFDYYTEYAMPHIQSVTLLQGTHRYHHPNQALGFDPADARVHHGEVYDIHLEKVTHH